MPNSSLLVACSALLVLISLYPRTLSASDVSVAQNRPAQTLCRTAVAWHIAEVDPRFGLTPSEMAKAVEDATAMWNQAAQRRLFEHVEQRGIAVSLEYDHRQQFFEQANLIYQQLEELRESVANYDEQLAEYLSDVDAFVKQIELHNTQIRTLSAQANQLVEEHSDRRGRVPAAIAREVNSIRSELTQVNEQAQRLVAEHNRIQQTYNNHVAERNLLAQQHGELARRLNQRIARQSGATDVGEHGIFLRSSGGQVRVEQEVISVYQMRSWQGLVTILAHEFGHAIGIGHVTDADSIMAARIESQISGGFPQQLSDADIAALNTVCAQARRNR